MQRIYLSTLPAPHFVTDDAALHHQLSRVLRARLGDRIEFFSHEYRAIYSITEITKRTIVFDLEMRSEVLDEGPEITLLQAIPNKIEKVEYLVEKGVETGISRFIFFPSERSQPLPLLTKKLDRIRAIAREALEQSGGFRLPEIQVLTGLDDTVFSGAPVALLHTEDSESVSLSDFARSLKSSHPIVLLVGPEGGWSDGEIAKYRALGATKVHLAGRILRTETAGAVTAFALGQMGGIFGRIKS